MIYKPDFETKYGKHRRPILFWLRNARVKTLPLSLLPAGLALTMSQYEPHFTWWIGLLALLGVAMAHLGLNLAIDYFYFRRHHPNNDSEEMEANKARFYTSTRCKYITSGQATMAELYRVIRLVFFLCSAFAFAAFLCRIYLDNAGIMLHPRALDHSALYMAFYGVMGMIICVLYTAGPQRFSEHGWGELIIGLMFGPLVMLGMQATCCSIGISAPMVVMSVAIGLLVINLTYISAVIEGGKDAIFVKNFLNIAHIGKAAYIIEMFNVVVCALLPYICLCAGVWAGWWDIRCLAVLALFPISLYLIAMFGRRLFLNVVPTKTTVFRLLSHHLVILWCCILIIAINMPAIIDLFE